MDRTELRFRCHRLMLRLDTPDENAAENAGDDLAKLLAELSIDPILGVLTEIRDLIADLKSALVTNAIP